MSKALILLPLIAFLLTWCVFPFTVWIAKQFNIVDNPEARKLQKEPIPVLGGVAVAVGIFIPLIIAAFVFNVSMLLIEIVIMVMLMFIGITDDIYGLPAWFRFMVELIFMWFFLWNTHLLLDDFQGLWSMPELSVFTALPLSLIAGVGIINAINLIDGVDGYSSGYGIFANLMFVIIFLTVGDATRGLFSAICMASLIPFLLHNVFGKKSKMFIGDGGSLLIGFIMVCNVFALFSTNSHSGQVLHSNGIGVVALALAILCIPVFDTLRVMFSRMIHGISPFTPDKTHLHHLYIDMGFSHVGTSMSIIGTNLLIVLIWYISYICGASVDLQFYIVVALGLLTTFIYYPVLRLCQKRKNKLWLFMNRVGQCTHYEEKGIWLTLQKIVDYGIF